MSAWPSSRVRIALLVSLALNLLLAATLAVLWLTPAPREPRGRGPFHLPRIEVLERRLPEADRPLLREVMAQHQATIHPLLPQLHAARQELREALAAEPYDATRVAAAFAAVRAGEAAIGGAIQAMLTELAGRVSPQGRQMLARALSRHHHHGRGERHRRGARGDSDTRPGAARDEQGRDAAGD
jgi:uncharacterized membrane protein